MRLAADESGYLAYDPGVKQTACTVQCHRSLDRPSFVDGHEPSTRSARSPHPFCPKTGTPAPNSQTDVPSGQADIVARFISGGSLSLRLLVHSKRCFRMPSRPVRGRIGNPPQSPSSENRPVRLRCFAARKKLTQLAPGDPARWHLLGGIASFAGHRAVAAEAYGKIIWPRVLKTLPSRICSSPCAISLRRRARLRRLCPPLPSPTSLRTTTVRCATPSPTRLPNASPNSLAPKSVPKP